MVSAIYDGDDMAAEAERIAREYVEWQQAEQARLDAAREWLPRLWEAVRAQCLAYEMGEPDDLCSRQVGQLLDEIAAIDELIIRQILVDVLRDGIGSAWQSARRQAVTLRRQLAGLHSAISESVYQAVTGELPRRTPGRHAAPEEQQ